MPTPIGHSMSGIAAVLLMGGNPLVAIVYANVPDLQIKGFWGHAMYKISHSILVNLILAGILILVTKSYLPLLLLVHLALDCCYEAGGGLGCLWPFSDKRVCLLRLFKPMDLTDIFGAQSIEAYLRDFFVMLLVLLLILL
jgi:hypothetical protein